MTNDLTLTFASVDYLDRTRALIDGSVKPAGLTLRHIPFTPGELFRRVAQYSEFDVAEFSMGTYMNLHDRGDRRYVAIPVFPSRCFRHGFIFVHGASDIHEPKQLIGRKVGVMEYQQTAAIWQRAVLEHDYGVRPQDMHWFQGGLKRPGYVERNAIPNPPGVTIDFIPEDRTVEEMVATGELDAVMEPYLADGFIDGSGRIRRLFPNFVEVEQEYYRRTGTFPIMHTVVIRRSLYEEHRWIAMSLFNAFVEAQRLGWQRLLDCGALAVMLPWLTRDLWDVQTIMGGGPQHWVYGYQENYTNVDALCQHHFEQGLSSRRLRPEELFAEETLERPIRY